MHPCKHRQTLVNTHGLAAHVWAASVPRVYFGEIGDFTRCEALSFIPRNFVPKDGAKIQKVCVPLYIIQRNMDKLIEIGSYIEVINGKHKGKVLEVFDKGIETLRAGITRDNVVSVDVNDVAPTTQLEFHSKNMALLGGGFF